MENSCCAYVKALGEERSFRCQEQDDEVVMVGGVELYLCRAHARTAKRILWRRGRFPFNYLPVWKWVDGKEA